MNKINTIYVILLLFSTVSIILLCKNNMNEKLLYRNNTNVINCRKHKDINTKNKTIRKWIEYKKIHPYDIQDTIPYHNCYIIIENDRFSYYKEGIIEEYRTMIRDTLYHYETYRFKEKKDDILQFYNYNKDTVVLFRDNYDGIFEFFINDNQNDGINQ